MPDGIRSVLSALRSRLFLRPGSRGERNPGTVPPFPPGKASSLCFLLLAESGADLPGPGGCAGGSDHGGDRGQRQGDELC